MSNEIRQNEWREFLKVFSKEHKNASARIEVKSDAFGDRVLSSGLPLAGIGIERCENDILLEILVTDPSGIRKSQTIKNPVQIGFFPNHQYLEETLSIEESNGTNTLVTVSNPVPISAGLFCGFEAAAIGHSYMNSSSIAGGSMV